MRQFGLFDDDGGTIVGKRRDSIIMLTTLFGRLMELTLAWLMLWWGVVETYTRSLWALARLGREELCRRHPSSGCWGGYWRARLFCALLGCFVVCIWKKTARTSVGNNTEPTAAAATSEAAKGSVFF